MKLKLIRVHEIAHKIEPVHVDLDFKDTGHLPHKLVLSLEIKFSFKFSFISTFVLHIEMTQVTQLYLFKTVNFSTCFTNLV